MNQQISGQYFEQQNCIDSISSDTLYLKERFNNNIQEFNNTVQGLKQCIEQIKRNEKENCSSQKIDKFQRVEQMLMERRSKSNATNKSIISQQSDRFNNQQQSLTKQYASFSQTQQNSTLSSNINIGTDEKTEINQINQDQDSKLRETLTKNYSQLQKFQQQYQNILEPEDNQFDGEDSSFLRGGVEELIKQKIITSQKNNKSSSNYFENVKTDRDSLGSGFLQNENDTIQVLQRFSDINEKKAEQFLQEFEDEDSIALPENICKLFPESLQTLEKNRLSEIERDFSRKSQGSTQNNHNSYHSVIQVNQKEDQNYRSSASQQDKVGQTQLDLNSEESSIILQDLNIYQFYSNQQQHALPIEDRLYVRNLSRENRIKQLQESQQKRIQAELQQIPKISKQSDLIAKNSSRFQENPDLVSRLMNDKIKKEQQIRIKQTQQLVEDEHRFTFAPQINQQSLNLTRGLENLYQWDQKRKIKQIQAQQQMEKVEEENIQKMKQSTFICEGSKKIVESQVRVTQKVEDRLIREGQCSQAKKKMMQEKENQMIKDMSNKKLMKQSQSIMGRLSSASRLDESSQTNQTNKTLTKQYSCDKINSISIVEGNNSILPYTYIQYCPNNFQKEQTTIQMESQKDLSNSQSYLQNQQFLNQNQYYSENTNSCKQRVESFDNYSIANQFNRNSSFFKTNQSTINNPNSQILSDFSQNFQSNQPQYIKQETQQKPIHHQKAISLHIESQSNLKKQQASLAFPLNAFKQSEKIILPKSINGKISVESLIQSAQFRKTKIFASDSQNMIILDKADALQFSSKNPELKLTNDERQVIDINQLLFQRQESCGNIKSNNINKFGDTLQQKENIPQSGRSQKCLSKQSSSQNLNQYKTQNLQQQNNLFFQQIKNEKYGSSYTNQFQKRKLQRTNSCLTNKYFSQN